MTPRSYGPRRALLLLVAASCCGAATACDRGSPPDVILVTIDTLRADRMGLYGYARPTSPNIDALGASGVTFDRAMVSCPATGPSVATMLTGLHRAGHGVRNNKSQLRDGVETLAQILAQHGYRTAASVSNPVIGHRRAGFGRGFEDFTFPDSVEESIPGGDDEPPFGGLAVVREAKRILGEAAGGKAPLFLWLHLMDPHGPYYPPRSNRELFDPEDYERPGDQQLLASESNYGLGVLPRYQLIGNQRRPAEYRARYDAEIRYADDHVGAIVELLRASGRWSNSVFVLTADHGESLGEHDYFFQHGWDVYDASLRVPLLLRAPSRLPGGKRVSTTVGLIDLAPTVLDLLGLPGGERMEGRSLRPAIEGREADRAVFAQNYYGNRLTALQQGDAKYILTPPPTDPSGRTSDGWKEYWPTAMREELYDLASDPEETRNLAEDQPEVAQRLRARVALWLEEQRRRRVGQPESPRIDRQLDDQLRALGYLK